jgi:hypothetical protein
LRIPTKLGTASNPTTRMTQTLEDLLHRSDELGECIFAILQPETYRPANPSSRLDAAIGLALISMEHATALRVWSALASCLLPLL